MKNKIYFLALLLYLFASYSCNDHAHDTEEPEKAKIKLTAYSSDFEVFAEADPFAVGRTSNVLSHFSHLPDFKALEIGSMTIRLVIDGKETIQTLDKPTRKGIYSFDITPEKQGPGKLFFDIKTDKGNYQIVVPDIIVYASVELSDEAANKIKFSGTNTTVFTKEQSWKTEFETAFPVKEPFGQVIKTTAQVQSSQGAEVIIAARTNGMVMFSGEGMLEGKNISQGQTVFSISGSDLTENNSSVRYAEAKNNYEKSKSDYERLKELALDKIVSEKELLSAKNEYDNYKLVYDNLNRNFNDFGQNFTSPMGGFIKQVFVKNGQFVQTGQPVISVSQNRTLILHADVQQKYAMILGSVVSANIRTVHDNITYTLEQLNGKILSFGKNANTDNYLIPLNLQIDNMGNFISGGFVELYLKTLTNSSALTIPNTSLIEDQGNFFVFVQIHPELFEKREVQIGATDGLRSEILKGIEPNDRVITKGAIMVKLAQSSGALDAHSGHVH